VNSLKHKVVVITGASSGIGRAAALRFADEGASLAIFARRGHVLEEVAEECRERGADVLVVPGDVTDAAALDRLARNTAGRYGRIDVWVNNAAVHLFAPIEDAPVEVWHRVVETNLFGTFHGVRAVLPWMREQGSGVIINVASVLSKVGSPWQSAYVASKYGVRGVSDCVRQEVRDLKDLRVCTVLPGPIDTPLFQNAGNHTGRAVKPIKPVIDANRVAGTIVSCARRPRREAAVGAGPTALLGLLRLFPGIVERATARQIDKDHFADRPAPRSNGNIMEPIPGEGSVSGGWARSGEQVGDDSRAVSRDGSGAAIRALVVAGAAGAAGAAARVVRGRRT
jgi:NAD(P)-dependent dehydrogenase (short-subunit alcohol dehydrogenase family)